MILVFFGLLDSKLRFSIGISFLWTTGLLVFLGLLLDIYCVNCKTKIDLTIL